MSLEVCTNESKKLYASHAPRNGCNVVKRLVNLFHGMGHVVVMDTSSLAWSYLSVLCLRVCMPHALSNQREEEYQSANKKIADKKHQRNIEWQRHEIHQ